MGRRVLVSIGKSVIDRVGQTAIIRLFPGSLGGVLTYYCCKAKGNCWVVIMQGYFPLAGSTFFIFLAG